MKMLINSVAGSPAPSGVQFLFDNNWLLSVIVGHGAYCDTRHLSANDFTTTCEIAVWNHAAKLESMLKLEEDNTVFGWFPVHQLSQLMQVMSAPDVTAQQIIDSVHNLSSGTG
jgi:hypothetical protein